MCLLLKIFYPLPNNYAAFLCWASLNSTAFKRRDEVSLTCMIVWGIFNNFFMNVNLRIQDSYSLALAASCSKTRSNWYSLPETTCKDIVWNIRFVLNISDGYILFSEHRVLACTVKLLAVNVASPSRAPVNWLIAHSAISASYLLSA